MAVLLLAGQHDAAARLREITIPGEGSVTYGQYQGGMPQQIVLPGGVVKSMAYDPLSGMVSNRVVDASGNAVMNRAYQRSRTGTITGMNTEHGNYSYSYDQIDQLAHVADPVLPDQAFSYDGAGNRVTSGRYPKPGTGEPELKTYTVNNLNQYLSVLATPEPLGGGGTSVVAYLSYDLNGNVTEEVVDGVSQVFRWDGENRLVGYSNSETGVSASYYYDPFGRRLRKVVNEVTNWYVYSEEGLVEEMDAQGNEIRSYGYAPDSPWMNNPVYMRVPGEGTTNIYYFLNDHLGAPQKMVAKNGEVVWSMESEAFGQATVSPDSTVTNNLWFSSQYFDEESGLHYNTQRYYGPDMGRYCSRDSIGDMGKQAKEQTGEEVLGIQFADEDLDPWFILLSSYAFVDNNTANFCDLHGLTKIANNGTPHRGFLRHNTYLEFALSCPKCEKVNEVKAHGENSVIDCIALKKYPWNWQQGMRNAFIKKWQQKGIDGLKSVTGINCVGDSVTAQTWMRTRFAGTLWGSQDYVDCYQTFIFLSYECVNCP